MRLMCHNSVDVQNLVSALGTRTGSWPNYVEPLRYPCIAIPIPGFITFQLNFTSDNSYGTQLNISMQPKVSLSTELQYIYLDDFKSVTFQEDVKDILDEKK